MIEEGTAWQFDLREEIGKRVRRSQGINQLSLLPVRQELLIDAQLFPNLTVSIKLWHYTHLFILHVRNDGCKRTV